jgi:UDP-glucose 4-epimerase
VAHYLVTGGCGFIGSHLISRLLADGHDVRVLDNLSSGHAEALPPQARLTVGGVTDAVLVQRLMDGVDGCFHLAARTTIQDSITDWRGTHHSNQAGTVTVFDAARQFRQPVPVVYASSASVYGDNPALPLAESASPRPLTAYAADKLGSELHGRVAWHSHAIPTTGLRFFNVYGPFQRAATSSYAGAIAKFAERLLRDEAITIYGDGGHSRDFVYVSDAVSHLLAAMQRQPAAACVYNVCTGRPTTLLTLAEEIAAIVGRSAQIRFEPARTGDIKQSLGDPAAAMAALGVKADVTLTDGLRTMLHRDTVRTAG